MRTSNLVTFNPSRDLPKNYNSSGDYVIGAGNYAIGDKAPGSAGGPALNDLAAAHGYIYESNIASVLVDTACQLAVYIFNKTWGEWTKAGAAAADYTKSIEERGQWAFTGQEGTAFYLVSDTPVVRATVHAARQ
jgi:hypothetical protein